MTSCSLLQSRNDIIAIHARNEVDRNALRTNSFALAVHGAASEVLFHHFHHLQHAAVAFRLALREKSEVRDFGGSEELGGTVRTLRDARAALDAFGGVHRILLHDFRDRNRVRLRRAAGVHGDEAAGLNDSVERTAIDDEVPDDRKGTRTPWLDPDDVAIFKVTHMQLTRRGAA